MKYKITVSNHFLKKSERGSLVDRGSNGGIIGNDAIVLYEHQRTVDVSGIDNHEVTGLKIVDASAKIPTQRGPVIGIFRQYAYRGRLRTIHSSLQFEHYKNKVDDRSMKVGGSQCIFTLEGYMIPLDIINGLPYMRMEAPTEKEFNELPHVIMTSGKEWNVKCLDNMLSTREAWWKDVKEYSTALVKTPFDEKGAYRKRYIPGAEHSDSEDDVSEFDEPGSNIYEANLHEIIELASDLNRRYISLEHDQDDDPPEEGEHITSDPKQISKSPIDYKKYQPYFLFVPEHKIKRTFEKTTQFAVNVMSGQHIEKTIQSPYPAHNVRRRNEPVATDTFFADVPAVGTNGQTMAQFFVGRKSLVIDIYGMKRKSEFVNALEDQIRQRGAMDLLVSDRASEQCSSRVHDILRALHIRDWQSEPHYQHQNFAEHRWKFLQRNVNYVMNWRKADVDTWLLCSEWCGVIMNHTAEKSLGWRPPLQVLTGQTVDISKLLYFIFWDVVYAKRYKDSKYNGQVGNKKTNEIKCRFVGFADHVGHALTFKLLTCDTRQIIYRSQVRLGSDKENKLVSDMRIEDPPPRVFISSHLDNTKEVTLPTVDLRTDPITVTGSPTSSQQESSPKFHDVERGDHEKPKDVERGDEKSPTPDDEEPVPELQQRGGMLVDDDSDAEDDDDDMPQAVEYYSSDEEDDDEEVDDEESVDTSDASEDDSPSPMDDPPLEDAPSPETVDEEDDVAEHQREHKLPTDPDDPNAKPRNFAGEYLGTHNPTVRDLSPEQMVDRTFLLPEEPDGSRLRAKVIKIVSKHKEKLEDVRRKNPEYIKFKCLVDGRYEDVVAYNQIMDHIEQDDGFEGQWKFRRILDWCYAKPGDTRYKDSRRNVLIEWETGEKSWEPVRTKDGRGLLYDDPVSLAIFAREKGLLGKPGWSDPQLMRVGKNEKKLRRLANQAKLHSFRTKPVYMYGILVPRNHEQAMQLDKENGNTKWRDAEIIELAQVDDYDTFEDKGKGYNPGPGWKKIRCHIVYAVKHDGRHKARLVAGGHLTDTPIDSVYSSVVSLRGVRLIAFIAEHNGLDLWSTDIGNAYLETYTKEKVYIIAGGEFGDRAGHTLLIRKALYGLKSSGLRWHERLTDVLRAMGFFPSKAERDIWMRDCGDHYEYIGVYVDDLIIASKDPQGIVDILMGEHNFKLKGTGEVNFHLGCDFFRDKDGRLCFAPRKYIEKMLANYERIYGELPKQASSPLTQNDHPELDASDLLDIENIKIYQSLVGALQWVIQIGRWDVCTAVMTLSRFRAAPRQGHLERVKRVHGYLRKFKHGIVRINTEEPDYSAIPVERFDWENTCYPGAMEEIPDDLPRPLGKPVVMTHFVDANLYHDLISGRSVTGILHLWNKTPIDWYSKLQSTVETATFGSEFVATRTCVEQMLDLRLTARYLGVPVKGSSMIFGDNQSVVTNSTVPQSKLTKRHIGLSYHKVREAIAAGIARFSHVRGNTNPADILSKHWVMPSVWESLRPLMFPNWETMKDAAAASDGASPS